MSLQHIGLTRHFRWVFWRKYWASNVSGGKSWCTCHRGVTSKWNNLPRAGLEPTKLPFRLDGWWLEFDILPTSQVMSGWVPTSDRAHSWQLYSTVPLRHQASRTLTSYTTQSHYHWTNHTCPVLIILSAWLGSDKYTFDWTGKRTPDPLHLGFALYRFGHLTTILAWTC